MLIFGVFIDALEIFVERVVSDARAEGALGNKRSRQEAPSRGELAIVERSVW